jgi:ribose 5-phosphate isomerase B
MRFVVGADDSSDVVEAVVADLRARGHEVRRIENQSWPEVACRVAEEVSSGHADQGVLFCWTGTGTTIAANKVPGARAALVWDPWIARGARLWNDANVLVMSCKLVGPDLSRRILDEWLAVTTPDPDEMENIARVSEIERRYTAVGTQ